MRCGDHVAMGAAEEHEKTVLWRIGEQPLKLLTDGLGVEGHNHLHPRVIGRLDPLPGVHLDLPTVFAERQVISPTGARVLRHKRCRREIRVVLHGKQRVAGRLGREEDSHCGAILVLIHCNVAVVQSAGVRRGAREELGTEVEVQRLPCDPPSPYAPLVRPILQADATLHDEGEVRVGAHGDEIALVEVVVGVEFGKRGHVRSVVHLLPTNGLEPQHLRVHLLVALSDAHIEGRKSFCEEILLNLAPQISDGVGGGVLQ
mmetsp:Transcript_105872/g.178814  ORF Transcript_105872/g.178814 Transcript_105872/m.178814 type:complete len:259 (-) Transcript_105872:214-990(-)